MANIATQAADESLPGLVDRAARTLAEARTSAEVLEARDLAGLAYDAAKRAARLAKAKAAFDDMIPRIHRAQADALTIEATAKRRIADEYEAAQERGEVATGRDGPGAGVLNGNAKATAADLGLSRKDIHEARILRDAEKAEPGIIAATVNAAVEAGEEPTRAKVRRAALSVARPERPAPRPAPGRGREAIAARVRDALTALSGLPPAHEVVGFLHGTDAAVIVDEHLSAAVRWLSDFSDQWGDEAC